MASQPANSTFPGVPGKNGKMPKPKNVKGKLPGKGGMPKPGKMSNLNT